MSTYHPFNGGYTSMGLDGRVHPTTHVAYSLLVGPIPTGLELDHLCRTPGCCNPWHLEPVTHAENVRRGRQRAAVTIRTGVCKNGHPFVNPMVRSDGRKNCRQCGLDAQKRWRDRQKAL